MVRLLEFQVSNLQPLWLQQQLVMSMSGCSAKSTEGTVGLPGQEGHDEETTCVTWVLALIFSLGIGVATALASRY
jgi:hypothetical protein